jgi:predicted unusual protein kinase regulating ubiquinone biosynthesis (AarF/ABC1/UbiB family)
MTEPRRRLGPGVAGGVLAVVAASLGGVAVWRRLPEVRRTRLRRSARVWRLTARRGVHYAVVKLTGVAVGDRRRQELEDRFAVATAQDVAAELGQMKGVLMKLGQLASVVVDGLPPEARAALAQLQADVPPMAPSLAAGVVTADLGAPPEEVFLDFDVEPVAAASIGQVHRAVTRSGHRVAVKVQYPGVADAIRADLDNAEMLYGLLSAVALPGLEPAALVAELRERMGEELDYRLEATNQRRFAERYLGHPWIRIPGVVDELCGEHVLTTDWCDGRGFAEIEVADEATRQHIAEVVFRFAQGSVLRYRSFNGDPHPGNYRFADDGTVVFLDFGLVKQWPDEEFAGLMAVLGPVLDQDPERLVDHMVEAGFLAEDHRLSAEQVWASVSAPYEPYFHDEFTFTPSFAAEAMRNIADPTGPNRAVMRALNLPGSFVIVNRVLWGMGGLLGRLGATNRWRGILEEYLFDRPPATPMGHAEEAWRSAQSSSEIRR